MAHLTRVVRPRPHLPAEGFEASSTLPAQITAPPPEGWSTSSPMPEKPRVPLGQQPPNHQPAELTPFPTPEGVNELMLHNRANVPDLMQPTMNAGYQQTNTPVTYATTIHDQRETRQQEPETQATPNPVLTIHTANGKEDGVANWNRIQQETIVQAYPTPTQNYNLAGQRPIMGTIIRGEGTRDLAQNREYRSKTKSRKRRRTERSRSRGREQKRSRRGKSRDQLNEATKVKMEHHERYHRRN